MPNIPRVGQVTIDEIMEQREVSDSSLKPRAQQSLEAFERAREAKRLKLRGRSEKDRRPRRKRP